MAIYLIKAQVVEGGLIHSSKFSQDELDSASEFMERMGFDRVGDKDYYNSRNQHVAMSLDQVQAQMLDRDILRGLVEILTPGCYLDDFTARHDISELGFEG